MTSEPAWGLYPWFEEHGPSFVHHDDLDEFRRLSPYGKIFKLIGRDGTFIIISYGNSSFRVLPDLFQKVPDIAFPIGSKVTIRNKKVEATVDSIQWHHGAAKPVYYLRRDGKLDSRRYSAEDLERA